MKTPAMMLVVGFFVSVTPRFSMLAVLESSILGMVSQLTKQQL